MNEFDLTSKHNKMPFLPHLKHICVSLLLMLPMNHALAQRHAQNWIFGHNAGINFKTDPPKSFSGSVMIQREGNATISDEEGALLFYTNGMNIWSYNHKPMKNGSGLKGQPTAAQSSIIAKIPQTTSRYIVFTVSDWQNSMGGLYYSVIDISANNGLGEVVLKNELLNTQVREQISAVYADKNLDVWVLCHELNNNTFVAYKLTKDGVNSKPVVSKIGSIYKGVNRYGQLKFSSNGEYVCATLGGSKSNNLSLFHFDQKTGVLSESIDLSNEDLKDVYSSEFSPDGSKLYVSAFNKPYIYQFDLSLKNKEDIMGSMINVVNSGSIKSCLQIGYDGKVYVSNDNRNYVGVISNPDLKGKNCGHIDNYVKLGSGKCRLGFPNFIQSYFDEDFMDTEHTSAPPTFPTLKYKIGFATNSSQISPQMAKELDKAIEQIINNPNYRVSISSHTDCKGPSQSNLTLSQRRATSTAEYIKKRVPKAKLILVKGFGESEPLASCDCGDCTLEELAKNRRSMIELTPE